MEVLKKYQNLENVFLEKIIAGDSAGANVLGQLFYSKNSKEISEGLRILPYKIVAHHIDGNLNPLKDTEPNLETIFLKEYETKVFYIDRKSVVQGKSVDLGGRRIIKKKINKIK